MSRIVKWGSEICKANTNNSTAKFQYSFSKASRFPIPNYAEQIRKKKLMAKIENGEEVIEKKIKKESSYPYYNIPSTLSLRKTSFGFGKKYDFTKVGNYCIKSCYNPGTDFDQKNPHGPKYSLTRAPRSGKAPIIKRKKQEEENEEKKVNNKKEIVDPDGPGPAKYNYLKPFGYDAPKVSMKFRHGNTPVKKKGEKEGEGEEINKKIAEKPYLTKVTIQISKSGKYAVSQIPNVNSIRFDKDGSKRTKFVSNQNPAPNKYVLPKIFGGHIIESQYRSYEPITIAQRFSAKDSRSNYPGPGSYIMPSDFGQYESKDASKYPKENVYVVEKPHFEEKAWRHNMKKIKPKKKKENNEYNNDYDYNNDNGNDYNNGIDEQHQDDNNTHKEKEETHQYKYVNVIKREKEEEEKDNIKEKEKKEEKKVENDKEPGKKEEDKEEEKDKKSEYILLRDILEYKEGENI